MRERLQKKGKSFYTLILLTKLFPGVLNKWPSTFILHWVLKNYVASLVTSNRCSPKGWAGESQLYSQPRKRLPMSLVALPWGRAPTGEWHLHSMALPAPKLKLRNLKLEETLCHPLFPTRTCSQVTEDTKAQQPGRVGSLVQRPANTPGPRGRTWKSQRRPGSCLEYCS